MHVRKEKVAVAQVFCRHDRRHRDRCAELHLGPADVEERLARYAVLYKVEDCACCPMLPFSKFGHQTDVMCGAAESGDWRTGEDSGSAVGAMGDEVSADSDESEDAVDAMLCDSECQRGKVKMLRKRARTLSARHGRYPSLGALRDRKPSSGGTGSTDVVTCPWSRLGDAAEHVRISRKRQ